MALRLLTKNAARAALSRGNVLNISRKTVGVTFTHDYTTSTDTKEKKSNILNSLPSNSLAAKAAYLTTGAGLASFLVSKEVYILNEETLVLISSAGLLGVLLQCLREPFTNMGNEHINRIKSVLNQARNDHRSAVQERIDHVGRMKDLVDITKALFEISRETAQLEAQVFELKQQVAVTQEVKSTPDSWVRHETSVREREQKQLAAYLAEKIHKDLQDHNVQQQILDQAVLDVQNVAKTN